MGFLRRLADERFGRRAPGAAGRTRGALIALPTVRHRRDQRPYPSF